MRDAAALPPVPETGLPGHTSPAAALPVPSAPARARCANCTALVTGEYCAVCGQRVEPPIRSISAFTRDAFESITHADSRLWRTVTALLLQPGRLTRDFLEGRRARYLPPFRLYLVVSVLFFLLASLLGSAELGQEASGGSTTAPTAGGDAAMASAVEELAREADQMRRGDAQERAAAEELDQVAAGTVSKDAAAICDQITYDGPWKDAVAPRARRACERTFAPGGFRALGREFMATLPHMIFLFLPVIAVVAKVLYWRPKRYYVEHLLFFVHNHAFAFALFTLMILLSAVLPEGAAGVATFGAFGYCAWYFFRGMRVVYGQSRPVTFAKYSVLAVTYLVSGIVVALATLAYSALAI